MNAAKSGGRDERRTALMVGYAVVSLALTGVHPLLPPAWAAGAILAVSVGAAAGVAYGRRAVRPGARRPWTLLMAALAAFVTGNVVRLAADGSTVGVGWLLDAAGNLLMFAAALAVILQRATHDLGGVIDSTVVALAAGSLLWIVLPHRLGNDDSIAAQVNLFVVVFALTGVLGALLRLALTAAGPGSALWWLMPAIGLSIAGNVVLSLASDTPTLAWVATVLFLAASTAVGLFGLDPSGPRLARPQTTPRERLSPGRLVFMAVAVAAIPIAVGTRDLLGSNPAGLLLALQGTLVAALVMARIGLLSAQRAEAERTLEHQAARDPLTQLLNRRELMARLQDALARGARIAILFCDLNDFKRINDQFGHDGGDALLVEVARRLQACVSPPHLVGRFGGDEFVVLLIDEGPAQVQATRECIVSALRHPFEPAGGVGVGVSVGVAYSGPEREPEQLIKEADRAMYREKPSRYRGRPYDRPRSPVAVDGTGHRLNRASSGD